MTKKMFKPKRRSKGNKGNPQGLAARVQLVEDSVTKNKLPTYSIGDTARVHVKIKEGSKERIQVFEGVVIKKKSGGLNSSFTVRKVSHGVGVERVFCENSPKIAKLEVKNRGKVRRAKLYYLRKLAGKAAKIEKEADQAKSKPAAGSAAPAAPAS